MDFKKDEKLVELINLLYSDDTSSKYEERLKGIGKDNRTQMRYILKEVLSVLREIISRDYEEELNVFRLFGILPSEGTLPRYFFNCILSYGD